MRKDWLQDLDELMERYPCTLVSVIKPRLLILPDWCSGSRFGAWVLFNQIIITQTQASCPTHVRRYVLSHEYGHIHGGHVYLQWAWLLTGMILLASLHMPVLALSALGIQCILFYFLVHPEKALQREFYADEMAASACGNYMTLAASQWMAIAQRDSTQSERIARLNRLQIRENIRS